MSSDVALSRKATTPNRNLFECPIRFGSGGTELVGGKVAKAQPVLGGSHHVCSRLAPVPACVIEVLHVRNDIRSWMYNAQVICQFRLSSTGDPKEGPCAQITGAIRPAFSLPTAGEMDTRRGHERASARCKTAYSQTTTPVKTERLVHGNTTTRRLRRKRSDQSMYQRRFSDSGRDVDE